MREYLRVFVYPCSLGLPPAYVDAYAEVPVVLEAAAEVLPCVGAMTSSSSCSAKTPRPLGVHGQYVLNSSPPSSTAVPVPPAGADGVTTTTTTSSQPRGTTPSRLRAGLDRLRRAHRSTDGTTSALTERPLNVSAMQKGDVVPDVQSPHTAVPMVSSTHVALPVSRPATEAAVVVVSAATLTHPRVVDAQLHYVTASLLSELEHDGMSLPARLAAGLKHAAGMPSSSLDVSAESRPTTHHTTSSAVRGDGVRVFTVYPVEEGRYMATLLIPPSVWQLLGPAAVSFIMETAVKGYDAPGPLAASLAAPLYFPLDARLKENAAAVQSTLQKRLEEVVHLVTRVREQQQQQQQQQQQSIRACARVPQPSSQRGAASAEAVIRRLVRERPSEMQCGGAPVRAVLSRLLREAVAQRLGGLGGSATTASDALATAGPRRFVAVAFGVWWDGRPVYSSVGASASSSVTAMEALFSPSTAAWYESQLLPAAIAVTLAHFERQRATSGAADQGRTGSIAEDVAAQRPTERLLAHFSNHQDALLRCPGALGGGFVEPSVARPERTLVAPSALTLCVAAPCGWTVVVRLEPSAVPFAGSTLDGIVMGVRRLCTQHLAAPAFHTFVRAHDPAMILGSSRGGGSGDAGGGGGALHALKRWASKAPHSRPVSTYSAASTNLLAAAHAVRIRARRVSHATGLGFSVSALAALHRDVSLFDWQGGDEDGVARLPRACPHVEAMVTASLSLTPLSQRAFTTRAASAQGNGIRSGAHSLFALRHTARGGEGGGLLTVFHAVKTAGPPSARAGHRRRAGHGGHKAASTSVVLYVLLHIHQRAYVSNAGGDSRQLLALTTWLLSKAYA